MRAKTQDNRESRNEKKYEKSFKKLLTMTMKNYILFIAGPRDIVLYTPM